MWQLNLTSRRLEEKLYTSRLTAIYAKHMLLRSYMDTCPCAAFRVFSFSVIGALARV